MIVREIVQNADVLNLIIFSSRNLLSTNIIDSIVLKSQPYSPKPVPDPPQLPPDLLSILCAANVEDGWKKAGKNAPDANTDILVDLGDNNQHPPSQLK